MLCSFSWHVRSYMFWKDYSSIRLQTSKLSAVYCQVFLSFNSNCLFMGVYSFGTSFPGYSILWSFSSILLYSILFSIVFVFGYFLGILFSLQSFLYFLVPSIWLQVVQKRLDIYTFLNNGIIVLHWWCVFSFIFLIGKYILRVE